MKTAVATFGYLLYKIGQLFISTSGHAGLCAWSGNQKQENVPLKPQTFMTGGKSIENFSNKTVFEIF